jgi:DNA topoisomerase IB
MPRLRRVDCSTPGITRIRCGRGFRYVDEDGNAVDEAEVVERIRELAIPPAWQDVWICPYPNGHLQATGVDAAGRKQYRYHDDWRTRRDQAKFDAMLDFARALPALRAQVQADLAGDELDRARVLACAVRLLDRGFFRIGSEDYAEQNDSYGLATLGKSHLTIDGDEMTFDYPAKSGKRRVLSLVDSGVLPVLAALRRRRGGGSELLAFKEGRRWVDVRSADINTYLKAATGGDFSAKDFRTWSATVLAAMALVIAGPAARTSESRRKRAIARAVREVAHYLGNTPAVARASYIDPRVFDRFNAGYTIEPALAQMVARDDPDELPIQGPVEEAVLELLEDPGDAELVEKVA